MLINILLLVMSWILYPIGLFKYGLSKRGYSINDYAPTWQRIMNLGVGFGATYLCYSFVYGRHEYAKGVLRDFKEFDVMEMTLTDPFEVYVGFLTWLYDGIRSIPQTLAYRISGTGQTSVNILGVDVGSGLLVLLAVIAPLVLYVAVQEYRAYAQRARHSYHLRQFEYVLKNHEKLKAKHKGALTEEQSDALLLKASRMTREAKDPGQWKTIRAPITGSGMRAKLGTNPYRWDRYDLLFAIEGLITPAITAAYAFLFFIPTLLIIGFWVCAFVMMFVMLMPIAWLYGNGLRMRMH